MWWDFQIKQGLLLSLPVKTNLKSVNIWHSYGQKCGLCLALSSTSSSAVEGRTSARDNHLLACNFAKYSPKKISLADSAINLSKIGY